MSDVGRCDDPACEAYGNDIPPAAGADRPPETCPKCGKALRSQAAAAAAPAEDAPFYSFREPPPAPAAETVAAAATEPQPEVRPQPTPPPAEPEPAPAPIEGINPFEIFEQALDELTEILRTTLDPERPQAAPRAPRVLWTTALAWGTALTLLLFAFDYLTTWIVAGLLGATSLAYLLRLGATAFVLVMLQRCNPFLRDLDRLRKKSKAKPAAAPSEAPPAA